jgi:hypothetical protein
MGPLFFHRSYWQRRSISDFKIETLGSEDIAESVKRPEVLPTEKEPSAAANDF